MIGGRYLDQWEKSDDEWRIAARKYIVDWKSPLKDQPMFDPDPEFPLPTLRIDAGGHPEYRKL